jgi:hypothetical protein
MRRSGTLPYREAGSGAIGHTALQSPPLQGGMIQSCTIHDTLEPSPVGRQDPEL